MISRVTMRKSGLAQYLKSGFRVDSEYSRDDKDNIINLYGNLDILEKAEDYTNKFKNWNYNYEHITISFNKEDMQRLDLLDEQKKYLVLKDIATLMIKHRTTGYDLDNEIIAYAEVHQPKIKFENDKERLEHIHIGISYLNAIDNTKVRTSFYNNSYISDTIDKYLSLKYNLTIVKLKDKTNTNLKAIKSDFIKYREKLKEDLKYIDSKEQLISYFLQNNIVYKHVKTKNNSYFKIINKNMKNINIRGKDFEHLSDIKNQGFLKELKKKNLQELEDILKRYYKQRSDLIYKRKSEKTKNRLKKINTYQKITSDEEKENLISYQQKLFLEHYDYLVDDDLKGYFIDIKKDIDITDNNKNEIKEVHLKNKQKNINIVDLGEKIISNTNSNLEEQASLMINIAIAKNWNLSNLKITGNNEFKKEIKKQIALKLIEDDIKNKKNIQIQRPISQGQELKKQLIERINKTSNEKNEELLKIKQNLDAKIVLDFAAIKYKLKIEHYELVTDNKINNKNNKQKPKNVIDFLQKEINLSSKEAIDFCKYLYYSKIVDKDDKRINSQIIDEIFKNQSQEVINSTLKKLNNNKDDLTLNL